MEENLLEEMSGEATETEPTAEEVAGEPQENAEDAPFEDAEIDYAALAREDLAALKSEFPALTGLSSLTELKDPVRYAELRDLGLSPKEAFLATGGSPQRKSDNRAHLRSAVPRIGALGDSSLSAGEMAEARRLFSDLNDAEIHRLYKKVIN